MDETDTISRQAAIEALARMMPRSYTPDGSHPADEEIFKVQEIYADCIESIEILPAVQPDHNADVSKKVDMMHEYIYKIVKDCDGVYCYIKQGEMIRCKDCEHWKNEHLCESLSRFGSFETKADFHCGYAERRTDV